MKCEHNYSEVIVPYWSHKCLVCDRVCVDGAWLNGKKSKIYIVKSKTEEFKKAEKKLKKQVDESLKIILENDKNCDSVEFHHIIVKPFSKIHQKTRSTYENND